MKPVSGNDHLFLVGRLWSHLSIRRRRQFGLLTGLMLISAFAEVVSLGAVLPFLGVLIAPDKLYANYYFSDLLLSLGVNTSDQLVFPLTVTFATAALFAGAIRIVLLRVITRLAFAGGADLGLEVYRRTLYQPYWVHVARNSSEVISGITNKVNTVVYEVLLPLLSLVSSVVLLIAIMAALVAINPLVAMLAAAGFGSCYALIAWFTRRELHRNSQCIAYEQTQVLKALQEGLGGIRDVLLDGTQQIYCDIYRTADHHLRRAQGNNTFIGQSPRFVMEALGMVLISFIAYMLSFENGGISAALPVLGALAIGAQRLLPAIQQIYYSWASIRGSHAVLADIISLLNQPLSFKLLENNPDPLIFQKEIIFECVKFRYLSEGPWVLDGLNLRIQRGARVGFVGTTGSGKSTALDLLMGLLMPSEGRLLVDDQPLTGNRCRSWQRTIAHVPQGIYLADATLAENIAFGVPFKSIDLDRVRGAARQAQIADFIEGRPEGYGAYVGERGVRLSGGQRQRIGIARALYKQASVLILDEATSALDNATEQSVMDAINGLDSSLTVLIIAHRLTTVSRCDFIVEMEQGRIVAQGTYETLMECSSSFRRMVAAT